VVLSACNNSKKCDTIPCPYECEDGVCICPPGQSGTLCEDIWAKHYVGVWTDEDALSWRDKIIIKSSTTDLSVLLFDDFWDAKNVVAKLTSKTTFKFDENQKLPDGYTLVSGEGTLNDLATKLTGSYDIKYERNGETRTIQFEFQKN